MSHVVQKVAGWRLGQCRRHFNVTRDRDISDWVMIVNKNKNTRVTRRRRNRLTILGEKASPVYNKRRLDFGPQCQYKKSRFYIRLLYAHLNWLTMMRPKLKKLSVNSRQRESNLLISSEITYICSLVLISIAFNDAAPHVDQFVSFIC